MTKITFEHISDIPEYEDLVAANEHQLLEYIEYNLDNPNLVLQAIDTRLAGKTIYDGDLPIAIHGWKVLEILGQGKDGITVHAHKYSDLSKTTHVIKLLSKFAKMYSNHSMLYNAMASKISSESMNSMVISYYENMHITSYPCDIPYSKIESSSKKMHSQLAQICYMNAWNIEYTGFVFWDLGYVNGRNFMMDSNNELKWVDYGGAGMLRCPNFYSLHKKLGPHIPELELLPNANAGYIRGKESLVIGDSDFVMCQFILNYEYWADPANTTADLYSSIIQVKRKAIPEILEFLPRLVKTKMGNNILNAYSKFNWLESKTWNSLGKYFNANA